MEHHTYRFDRPVYGRLIAWHRRQPNHQPADLHRKRLVNVHYERRLIQHRRHYHERADLQRELQRLAVDSDTQCRHERYDRLGLHLQPRLQLCRQRRRDRRRRHGLQLSRVLQNEPGASQSGPEAQRTGLWHLQAALRLRPEVAEQQQRSERDRGRLAVDRPIQLLRWPAVLSLRQQQQSQCAGQHALRPVGCAISITERARAHRRQPGFRRQPMVQSGLVCQPNRAGV